MRSSLYGGLAFVAILSMGLVLAACGSSSSTTTTASALSRAAFLVKGNAICAAGNKATNKIASTTFSQNKKPTTAQVTQFANRVTPIIQAEIDKINALPAPSGDEAKVKAVTSAAQQGVDAVKKDPTVFLHGNPFAKANQAAKSYGLTACAGGGGGGGSNG